MYRKPSQLQAEVADVAWRARELELAEADAVASGGGMPASSAWAGPPDAAAAAAPLGRTHMLATGGLGMQPPPDTPVNDAALEAAALMQRLVVASNRQAMVLLANEDLAGSEAWLCKAQQALYRARVTGAARFMPAGEESEGGLHVLTYNNIACFQRRAGNLNAALQCLRDAVLEGERGGATDQQLAVTHSNLCAILSEIGKHPLAMTYARAAVLHCKRALKLQVPKPAGTAASAANAMTAEQKREKARLRAERGIQKAAGEEPAEEEGGPSDHMKAAASQAEQRVQQHKTIMALAVACHNLAVEVEFVEGKPCLHWYAKAAALAERAAMLSAAEAGSGKDADMVASSMALAKKLVESNKSATAKWKRKSLVVVRTSGNTARSLRKPGTAGGRKGRGRSRKSRSGSGGSRDAHYSTSLGGGGGNDGADGNRDDGEGERPEWNDDPIVAHELRPAALDNDLDLLDETEKAALFGKAKRTDYYADSPVVSSGYGQPPSPDKKGRSGDDADAGDAEDEGREDDWASSKRGDGKRSKYSAEELRRFDFELSELDLGLGIALDPHQPELVGVKKRPKSRPRTGTGGRPLPGKKTRRQGDKRSKSPGKGGKANGKAGTLEMDEAVAKKIQSKLKAACYGTTPQVLFSRWDKDGGGTLDHAEFKRLVRAGLKIPPRDLPDEDIALLIHALDDDDNGALSIAELADFVERGAATFHSGPVSEHAAWGDHGHAGMHGPMDGGAGGYERERDGGVDGTDGAADGHGMYEQPRGLDTLVALDAAATDTVGGTPHGVPTGLPYGKTPPGINSLTGYAFELDDMAQRTQAAQHASQRIGKKHPPAQRQPPPSKANLQKGNPLLRKGKYEGAMLKTKNKRKGKRIDEAVAKKIQSKLKAACYGTTPQVLFSRWDKDGGGTLDHAEFKKMVRVGLKIPPSDLADQLIKALIKALDDDNNGELSIAELADFVERGTATFYAGPEAEDVVWGDNGAVANDGDDCRAAAEAGARAGMEVEAVPHTPYASGRGGEGTDVGADVGADIGHTPYTNAEALIDKAELELVYERAKANVLGGRTPGSPARPEPGGFMYGVGAEANASMGADADAGIDRDELERVYERAKTHVLASMDSPSRADTLANGGGGAGVALPSPIDVGLRQHMGGTEYDISGQRIDAVEEGGDGYAHTFPEFMRFHNDDHDAALRQWVGSKVLQYAQDVGGAVAAAATVPESPMARSHLSAATGSSAGDNAYMNQAAGLLAAAREQAQRLTPGGASRSQSAMLSPDARARSVSSGEEHVFGTADESPDRAAKVLTILDSAEREARRKSLAAAQMAEDLAQMAAVAEAEAAVDAAERTADEAVATTAATTATERAAQEAEDMLAMLDASEEEEAARVNAEVAAKEAARNAARSASGMRSAGKSPSTGGPARHNLGVGEQRSQRSEDLVWEQVQEQERTVKDRAQQDLHPELGESPYHQKLTGAPGASYARATAADDDAAAAGGEGGDGGRGKRRGKPKSPKYFSHASQRAGNVPTPQEEYVARKRLDKIEKGIEQMMSDESRRHPPTWKIKHQKDVEKQELDRALAEALGVIEQKEKALGIGQRLNYGISAGGAAGGGGGRKVPRSLKGMSLTATANFKSAIGAV